MSMPGIDGARPAGATQGGGPIGGAAAVDLPPPGSPEMAALQKSFRFDQLHPVDSQAKPAKFPDPVPSRADMQHMMMTDNDVISRWGNLSPEQEALRQSLPPAEREQFDATLVDSLRLAMIVQTDGPLPPDVNLEMGSLANALFSQADPKVPFPGPLTQLDDPVSMLSAYADKALGEGSGAKIVAVLQRLGPAFASDPELGPEVAGRVLVHEYEKTHPGYWFPEGDSRRGPVLPAHPSNMFETLSQSVP